jgi:CheY-like chemotaxis protein
MGMQTLSDVHILVVEDEYFVAQDIVGMLRANGADIVGPVGNIDQAMRLVTSGQRIDAAVLDVNVHGGTTYPIADALRSRGVPFLFATGYDDGHLLPAYSDVPRCRKPLNWRGLITSLSDLVRPAGAR